MNMDSPIDSIFDSLPFIKFPNEGIPENIQKAREHKTQFPNDIVVICSTKKLQMNFLEDDEFLFRVVVIPIIEDKIPEWDVHVCIATSKFYGTKNSIFILKSLNDCNNQEFMEYRKKYLISPKKIQHLNYLFQHSNNKFKSNINSSSLSARYLMMIPSINSLINNQTLCFSPSMRKLETWLVI